eukprot:GFKZ01005474.1.p1 GENE.GFKZ01005474.1~~GFKZ01005474.1.p1  ORF type:complete len:556 (-),score=91.16 GFKZ01005474.1:1001-2668(-)
MISRIVLRGIGGVGTSRITPRLSHTYLAAAAVPVVYRLPYLSHRRYCTQPSEQPRVPFTDLNQKTSKSQALLERLQNEEVPDLAEIEEAVSLASQASTEGSPRAKTILASMRREGFGIEQDRSIAKQLFQEAAVEGDPIAQCSLGVLMLQDLHTSAMADQKVSSSELMLELDEKGAPRARLELEMEDGKPISETPTPAELVRRVRKARRKAGYTDQESREFEEFQQREKERRESEERVVALTWLEKAVEQGNGHAMVALANEILQSEPLRAVELYKRAVKKEKNTDAYYNLGQLYTSGVDGIEVDLKAASMNFAMAAQLGDPNAQFYLGHLYRVGSEHVKPDAASARQYVELAAEQNHPGATYYLALMHKNGEGGLEPSDGAFLRYLTKAAELGYGPAHTCLGDMYYKGIDGVSVDYPKALKHFTQAGQLGESDAYCSAAAMHYHGYGTAQNHHEAFLLYQEAAQSGSVAALRNIGSMYHDGHGVPVNKKVAAHFFETADQIEKEERAAAVTQSKNTPIRTSEAPKHPMADIPRHITEEHSEEDAAFEAEWDKLK